MDAALRRERLLRSRLYAVCDGREASGDLESFLDAVLGAGVDIVQLRAKDAEAGDLLRWAAVFAAAAGRHDALFIVNDRADVAAAAGADGVHLGQNDLPPADARRLLGDAALIGLSTHSAEQLGQASPEADYLSVGPVYATPTKPGRPATGLDYVRRASGEARPWFAIGGIGAATIGEVLAAGARRVAVVRALTEAPDPALAAVGLARSLSLGGP